MDYYKVNPEKGGGGGGVKNRKKALNINKSKWNTEKPSFCKQRKKYGGQKGEGDKRGKNYEQRRSEKERRKKKRTGENRTRKVNKKL